MFFKKTTRKTRGRIESKKRLQDKIPEDRMCSECEHSDYIKGMRIKDCIYICKKNPKCPVKMGSIFHAQHKNRKNNKEEQYQKRGRK